MSFKNTSVLIPENHLFYRHMSFYTLQKRDNNTDMPVLVINEQQNLESSETGKLR
jgi:hypothetical protein